MSRVFGSWCYVLNEPALGALLLEPREVMAFVEADGRIGRPGFLLVFPAFLVDVLGVAEGLVAVGAGLADLLGAEGFVAGGAKGLERAGHGLGPFWRG